MKKIIMNEIFIIIDNKYSFVELIFDEFKNELIFQNDKYNFEFISKNKLKIFKELESYILETIDSYIYTNKYSYLLSYKLIRLNHNEWFDQAILITEENKIIRIKDRNQFGKYKIEEDKIIIEWDYWGKEEFILYDENTYNHELYKNYKEENIIIFIHLCNLNNGYEIFMEQYDRIMNSKFYDNIKKIYICYLGEEDKDLNIIKRNKKIEYIYLSKDIKYYEFLTINKMKEIVDSSNENYKILYIHNKGTRKAGNEDVIKSWREMMEYFLIDEGLECINSLEYYDTIGCNIINKNEKNISNVNEDHSYHYSGNFWWSKSEYIKTLNKLIIDENKENREKKRFQCENWLLSKMSNNNIGVIYQDNTNIHPYHRYIFENYKNRKLIIKKIN